MKEEVLTHAFMAKVADREPLVIFVGVVGKQRYYKDILPNLKRALTKLGSGKRFPTRDLYIWGIDYTEDPVDAFNQMHKKDKFVRIFLYPDGTHKIFRGST